MMTAQQLRAWRARLGLSVRGAARSLGLAPASIQRYEYPPDHERHQPIPLTVELACEALERRASNERRAV